MRSRCCRHSWIVSLVPERGSRGSAVALPPFKLTQDGDWFYGRGAIDMKDGDAALVATGSGAPNGADVDARVACGADLRIEDDDAPPRSRYVISPRSYECTLATVYHGHFDEGRVARVDLVQGLT
jgi:hypothetical protein